MAPWVLSLAAAAPVAVLIFLMVKRNPWPSYKALPFAALLLYLIKLVVFRSDPNITNATVLRGLLDAATPVLIIWGAVLLFKVMEASGSMDTVRGWLNRVTDNRVAQLMIISFAFGFLIEGASGFGTPAALAAPLLVGLGFEALPTAVCCLIMNSFPVSFGAVGTPTWFGLGSLGLDTAQIMEISWKSALMHGAAALVIPLLALKVLVSWREIRRNLVFIYLSVLSCIIPYVLIAQWSYEFPSLVGGGVGFILTVLLAGRGIGLAKNEKTGEGAETGNTGENPRPGGVGFFGIVKALFPLWGSVLMLIVTRVKFLHIKECLQDKSEWFCCHLGSIGDLEVSCALVTSLKKIFGTGIGWSLEFLYLPAIIPFLAVSFLTFLLYRMKPAAGGKVLGESFAAMRYPVISLLGALVLVALLLDRGVDTPLTPAKVIGTALAQLTGAGWQYIAPYLGALGAFFSGSNTVSNLTFGGIQLEAAKSLNLDVCTILALQSVGGSHGNMICINNIVAVGSILGLASVPGYEGAILKRTFIPCLLYGVIALLVVMAF